VKTFLDDPGMWVSHETIYQALYVQPRRELARQVKAALRTGRAQRKSEGRNPVEGHSRFKDMINIRERPAEADDRATPGHWEKDLVIGKDQASQIGIETALHTEITKATGLPACRPRVCTERRGLRRVGVPTRTLAAGRRVCPG
jgi:IS30 family transposase